MFLQQDYCTMIRLIQPLSSSKHHYHIINVYSEDKIVIYYINVDNLEISEKYCPLCEA